MATQKLNLFGVLNNNVGEELSVSINVVQFTDNETIVLYAPALEVYGYGLDLEEAKDSFLVCLREFINYSRAKGTFEDELRRMGWKIKGRKNARKYKTPVFSDLLMNNKNLVDIINSKEFQTHNTEVPLAMA